MRDLKTRGASAAGLIAAAAGAVAQAPGADTAVRAWGWQSVSGIQFPADLRDVAQLSCAPHGELHGVAVTASGGFRSWGWDLGPPADLGPLLMVDTGNAGDYNPFVIALEVSGRVRCFGSNWAGACDVPASLGPAVHVAAGSAHSLAVDRRGRVWAWGWNIAGECEVPDDLPPARAVAAGESFSIAILRDGRVRSWGGGGWGYPGMPEGLGPIQKADGARGYAVLLSERGQVIALGGPQVPTDLRPVVDVAAGGEDQSHVVALQDNGTVRSWGNGAAGQTSVPADLGAVMQVTAGSHFQFALACTRNRRLLGSPQLVPFSFGNPRTWVAKGIAAPRAGAVVRVAARGQLGTATRFLTVRADGVLLGTIFGANTGAGSCTASPSVALLPISAEQFASMASDGAVDIRIEPSINATSAGCDTASLTVTLQYEGQIIDCDSNGVDDICQIESAPLLQDCNGNGLLDACEPMGSETDCDGNGVFDSCDISRGAPDEDSDGRIDDCELSYGDLNLDGTVDGLDLAALVAVWGIANPPYGDLNGDGLIQGADISFLLARWGPVP